jgi:DNA-binding transcriptional ArsR family regulator
VTATVALLEQPDKLRVALSPLRKQLLARLQRPASASALAAELDLPRQRVNYHLRVLEQAGLIELAEERQRRGCQERIMRAAAGAFIVDPGVMTGPARSGDQHSAERLVAVAAATVRDVTRMRASAEQQGKRLLTFSIEADVQLGEPGDMSRFTEALAAATARVIADFQTEGGRPYRVVLGGHPAPANQERSNDL